MASPFKLGNEYAQKLGAIFDECPKAVIAAIAVSVLTGGGDYLDEAAARFAEEWDVLNANGIVPQKPGKAARAAMLATRYAAAESAASLPSREA